MINFSFFVDMLKEKYSSIMERTADDVIKMFKFLLLKSHFKLSGRGLIKRTMTDILFEYFPEYNPENTKLINPTLLTIN